MTCIMASQCRNSEELAGSLRSMCALCRLSEDNLGRDMTQYWSPIETRLRHPILEAAKRQKKIDKHNKALNKKRQRDPKKRQISRQAQQAEKKTERNIIHATKNSGRRNKDGDHVSAGRITLDTKLQTTRENPVIYLGELEKVREDAMRAGKRIGGLVIRNKYGVGCVVLREDDYAILAGSLKEDELTTHRFGQCQGESEGVSTTIPFVSGTPTT